MTRLTVSVIIPVYNTAEFLRECVGSVPDKACVEVILIDNGSTDGASPELCDAIAHERTNVRVIHTEKGGIGDARNLGIKSASGDYVMFLDSDDLFTAGAVDAVISAAEEYGAPNVIAFGFSVRENGKDLPYRHDMPVPNGMFSVREHPEYLISLPSVWSRAWKRTFLLSTKIRFPSRIRYEDLAAVPALLAAADGICAVDAALYIYRRRQGSVMTESSPSKNLDVTIAFEHLTSCFDSLGLSEVYARESERLAVEHIILAASARVLADSSDDAEKTALSLVSYVRGRFPDIEKNPYVKRLSPKRKLLLYLLLRGHLRTARTLIKAYNLVK